MATQRFTLRSDMWTLVGTAPCFIQLQGKGPVEFYIGAVQPDLGASGFLFPNGQDRSANITFTGQSVWARNDDMTLGSNFLVVAS